MDMAEGIDNQATCFRVLGKDTMIPIIVMTAVKTTVHWEWSLMVFKILDPVNTWNPIKKILFSKSMIAVASYATAPRIPPPLILV